MVTLALAPEDCDRLARASRLAARAITITSETTRHLELAAYLEAAANTERAPPVPERWVDRTPEQRGPPPQAVDTFPRPADPAAWGDSPHDQEPR